MLTLDQLHSPGRKIMVADQDTAIKLQRHLIDLGIKHNRGLTVPVSPGSQIAYLVIEGGGYSLVPGKDMSYATYAALPHPETVVADLLALVPARRRITVTEAEALLKAEIIRADDVASVQAEAPQFRMYRDLSEYEQKKVDAYLNDFYCDEASTESTFDNLITTALLSKGPEPKKGLLLSRKAPA